MGALTVGRSRPFTAAHMSELANLPQEAAEARRIRMQKLKALRATGEHKPPPAPVATDPTAMLAAAAAAASMPARGGPREPVALGGHEDAASQDDDDDAEGEGASASGDPREREREKRKHARMIRNRMSAAASRKRKSDRISELEGEVAGLREENCELRRRLGLAPHPAPIPAAAAAGSAAASTAVPGV